MKSASILPDADAVLGHRMFEKGEETFELPPAKIIADPSLCLPLESGRLRGGYISTSAHKDGGESYGYAIKISNRGM